MYNFPDLTWLIYFGFFGIACATLITLIGGGYLAYHLYMALALYIGA